MPLKTLVPYLPAVALFLVEAGLQVSGYTNPHLAFAMWGLAALALIIALWHTYGDWQRPKVGPSHIIILGLLIAAGGVLWQQFWWHPPAVSGAPAQQHQAVSTTPIIEPKLDILYRPDLPTYYFYNPYQPMKRPDGTVTTPGGVIVFYRLKIVNLAQGTTAHGVQAFVDRVQKRIDGDFKDVWNGIPLPLKWLPLQMDRGQSVGNTTDKIDLGADGDGRFVQFMMGQRSSIGTPEQLDALRPDFFSLPDDRQTMFADPGLYRITVQVKTGDSPSASQVFIVRWNGNVDQTMLSAEISP